MVAGFCQDFAAMGGLMDGMSRDSVPPGLNDKPSEPLSAVKGSRCHPSPLGLLFNIGALLSRLIPSISLPIAAKSHAFIHSANQPATLPIGPPAPMNPSPRHSTRKFRKNLGRSVRQLPLHVGGHVKISRGAHPPSVFDRCRHHPAIHVKPSGLATERRHWPKCGDNRGRFTELNRSFVSKKRIKGWAIIQ